MSLYVLEAKDCSPFEVKGGKEPPIDIAMRQLCNYWFKADGYSENDDYLACLRTSLAVDVSTNPTTQWWAGRYIGIAKLKVPVNKSTTHQFDISIRPRYGEHFLLAILEDLFNIKVGKHDAKDTLSSEWFSSLLHLLQKRIWVEKCSKANRYGLPRANVKREYQGVTIRGALDVNKSINPWLMQKEVCTIAFEKQIDEHIGVIVYEAHKILSHDLITPERRKTKDTTSNHGFGFSIPTTVQDTINALNTQFRGTQFNLTENDYQSIHYKSIYQSWKPLVDFSWSVIRGRKVGQIASDSQTECIFVDMAEIWEAYLRKKIGNCFKADGWRVLSVEECRFPIYEKTFYKRDIIPDIILQKENNYMVFDAKYKRMKGEYKCAKNSDIDRTDLFQIHTYIQYFQRCLGRVVLGGLLYPITSIEDVDTSQSHADNLFGGNSDDNKIPFIVDGIYCSNNPTKDELDQNINNMVERIKKAIPISI